MKCSKCGAELSADTKFCSYCGNKVEVSTPPPISGEKDFSETIQYDSMPSDNTKKSFADALKDKGVAYWNKLSLYGKITTVVIAVFAVLALIAFLAGKVLSGVIALISVVLTAIASLMKKGIIKTPKNWLPIVALAVAVLLVVPYFSLFGGGAGSGNSDDGEKLNWSNMILGDILPQPESNIGEVLSNQENYLSVYIHRTSSDQFYDYITACKNMGFTVDAEQLTSSYYAYNDAGYKLALYYTDSDDEMHIGLDAPKQYGEISWPTSGLGALIPVPESQHGNIEQDDEQGFGATVSETSLDAFHSYVEACVDKGFTVEAYETDKSYSAENGEGYKLSVTYMGNNVISISVDVPEYEVSVEIECVENLLFSTYDVDVYIDDSWEGSIDHGASETFDLTLTKGIYEIKLVSADDDEITGAISIDIHKDESLKYKISCTSTKINVETIVGTIAEYGEDESPMPQSASDFKYENYADVQKALEDAGFTNISFEILYDIVIGWTEEGEVDSVSVNGTTDFEKGDIFKKDAPIVITYHMNEDDDPNKPSESEPPETTTEPEPDPEPVENLTAENCPDLAALLALRDPSDPSVAAFASKYSGQVIEFDGCVTAMQNHGSYTTRWDVLLGAGDFDANSMRGPNFRLTDVNYYDMNVTGGDSVYTGLNVHIVAEVGAYNANTTLFELDIISMEIRN